MNQYFWQFCEILIKHYVGTLCREAVNLKNSIT